MTESEARQIWDVVPHDWREKFVVDRIKERIEDRELHFWTCVRRDSETLDDFFRLELGEGFEAPILSSNLRAELLEQFSYEDADRERKIARVVAALRAFADELEASEPTETDDV
jgi:hypothetical protein